MAPPRKFVREVFHRDEFDDIKDENALYIKSKALIKSNMILNHM